MPSTSPLPRRPAPLPWPWPSVLLALTLLLAGCGQKGDLYLPDTPSHAPAAPTAAQIPAAD